VNSNRRLRPRVWHTDWLILRGLARLLTEQVQRHVTGGSTLLDLGCGAMPYRELIHGFGIRYLGADIGRSADLEIDGDGRVALEAHSCDAILSVQVLEHVADLDAYCSEIRRLLRDNGTLFLSTHGTWLYHPHPEDYRRWTRTGLSLDLEQRGLAVAQTYPVVGPLATTTLIRLTGFAYVLRKLPVVGGFLAGALAVTMNLRALLEDYVTPASMRLDNACVYLAIAKKNAP
jgi:SAM-dependent methyltransferase